MKSVFIALLSVLFIFSVYAQTSFDLHSVVVRVSIKDCTGGSAGSFRIVNHNRASLRISLSYIIHKTNDSLSFFGSKEEAATEIILTTDSSYTVPVALSLHYNVYPTDAAAGSAPILSESQTIEACKLTIVEIK